MTAKITAEQLTENYHQAGLRVYSDDDNWASVHMISAGGQRDIEFIYESAGSPRNEAPDKLGGIPADCPDDVLGADRVRRPAAHGLLLLRRRRRSCPSAGRRRSSSFANPRIGPVALSDAAPSVPDAFFDWIRFEPDGSAVAAAAVTPSVDEFDGTALADARPGRSCARTRTSR